MRRPWPALGRRATKKSYLYIPYLFYIVTIFGSKNRLQYAVNIFLYARQSFIPFVYCCSCSCSCSCRRVIWLFVENFNYLVLIVHSCCVTFPGLATIVRICSERCTWFVQWRVPLYRRISIIYIPYVSVIYHICIYSIYIHIYCISVYLTVCCLFQICFQDLAWSSVLQDTVSISIYFKDQTYSEYFTYFVSHALCW
jgi:hypothetical protein